MVAGVPARSAVRGRGETMVAGVGNAADNTLSGLGGVTDLVGADGESEADEPVPGGGWLIVALVVLLLVIIGLVLLSGPDPQGACDNFYDTGTSAVPVDNGSIFCR